MNLSKSMDFFDPTKVTEIIHIIGCGSVGSAVAELLARFGLRKFRLYDFDTVEEKNIANQMFFRKNIGKQKVDVVADMIRDINDEAEVEVISDGWNGNRLNGYVFLCVDNIELRKQIATANKFNSNIKAMFDFRTGLTDAQHFCADWRNPAQIKTFINSMNFTHEEAKEETPTSACGIVLGVAPTVRMIVNAGVSNFVNFVKGIENKKYIFIDAFTYYVEAF